MRAKDSVQVQRRVLIMLPTQQFPKQVCSRISCVKADNAKGKTYKTNMSVLGRIHTT
jgi:hypothetical protein